MAEKSDDSSSRLSSEAEMKSGEEENDSATNDSASSGKAKKVSIIIKTAKERETIEIDENAAVSEVGLCSISLCSVLLRYIFVFSPFLSLLIS